MFFSYASCILEQALRMRPRSFPRSACCPRRLPSAVRCGQRDAAREHPTSICTATQPHPPDDERERWPERYATHLSKFDFYRLTTHKTPETEYTTLCVPFGRHPYPSPPKKTSRATRQNYNPKTGRCSSEECKRQGSRRAHVHALFGL